MRIMTKYGRFAELQKAFDALQEKKRSSWLRANKLLEGKKVKRIMLILPLKYKNSGARAYFGFITIAATRCNSALGLANVSFFWSRN